MFDWLYRHLIVLTDTFVLHRYYKFTFNYCPIISMLANPISQAVKERLRAVASTKGMRLLVWTVDHCRILHSKIMLVLHVWLFYCIFCNQFVCRDFTKHLASVFFCFPCISNMCWCFITQNQEQAERSAGLIKNTVEAKNGAYNYTVQLVMRVVECGGRGAWYYQQRWLAVCVQQPWLPEMWLQLQRTPEGLPLSAPHTYHRGPPGILDKGRRETKITMHGFIVTCRIPSLVPGFTASIEKLGIKPGKRLWDNRSKCSITDFK